MRYPDRARPPKRLLRCVCRQGRDGGYSRAVVCQNRLPCGFRTVRLWHDAPRPEKPRKCSTARTRRRPYAPAPRLFCVPVLAAFDLSAAFRQDQALSRSASSNAFAAHSNAMAISRSVARVLRKVLRLGFAESWDRILRAISFIPRPRLSISPNAYRHIPRCMLSDRPSAPYSALRTGTQAEMGRNYPAHPRIALDALASA